MTKQTTDQKTLGLIKDIQRRKEEISKLEKPNWKTNCSFSYVEGRLNDSVNIHVESDIQNLVKIAGFLMGLERDYSDAGDELNIKTPCFTWSGFNISDWLEDIKTRIDKIQITSKKKKLEILEGRLNAIISPELRAELELQSIQEELE